MYSLPSGSDVSVVDDKVAIFCLLPLLLLGLHRSSELRNTYNKRWSSLGLQTTALDIPKVYLVAEIELTSFPGGHCTYHSTLFPQNLICSADRSTTPLCIDDPISIPHIQIAL
jgi:hypothetical protein